MRSNDPVVFVVDDDSDIREALCELLACMRLRAMTFSSAAEYLACRRPLSPACLLLDIGLPDISGLDLQRSLAGEDHPPIIFITGSGSISSCARAMKAGALDFLAKPFTEQELMEAINRALAHDRASQIDREERMSLRQRLSGLTPRERDVLELVVGGFRNKQAAAQLRIGEGTLQIHRCRVMRKMRAKSFADLVRMAGKLPLLAQPGSVFPMDTMRAGCDHAPQ